MSQNRWCWGCFHRDVWWHTDALRSLRRTDQHTRGNVLQAHFWLPPCEGLTVRPKHPVISSCWAFPSCLLSLLPEVLSSILLNKSDSLCSMWWLTHPLLGTGLALISDALTLLVPVFLDHSITQGLNYVPPSPWLLYPDIMFCCYFCSRYPGSLVARISSSVAEECWWMRKGINEQTSIFASDI